MNDQRHEKPRTSHAGFISLFIFTVLKILLMSALAWFVLLIWFMGKLFYSGEDQALNTAHAIASINLQFMQNNPAALTHSLMKCFATIQTALNSLSSTLTHWYSAGLAFCGQLLLAITEIQITRLFIFILALPLFILMLLVFITDGLVKRDIRKFQGARESTLIFHRIKGLSAFCFFVPFFIYLALPMAISPVFILLPQILLFSSVTALSITYFKKYL